ncbi:Os01g0761600, partial [Oryza sativa Japonica Group]
APHEVGEVGNAQRGEDEVVVVVVPPVEVAGEPAVAAAAAPGAGVDGPDDGAPGHAAEPHAERQQRDADAGHGLGELGVVELDLPDQVQRLGESRDAVLRHQPHGGHAHGAARLRAVVAETLGQRLGAAGGLGARGHGHGHGEERQADAHPLPQGDAARVAGEPRQRADERAVVDGHPDGEREDAEDAERRRGDLQPAHPPLHRLRLQHGEHLLADDHAGHEPRRPYRQHADGGLDVLHLLHRAQRPRVARRAVVGVHLLVRVVPQRARTVQPPQPVRRSPRLVPGPVVEARRVGRLRRQGTPPLPVAGDEHLHEADEHAPVGLRLEVEGRAEEEQRERGEHEHDGHGEADDPPLGLLDVHDDGGGEHDGEAQHGVVPVEEGLQRTHVPGAVVAPVQLVRPERQRARPDATRPNRHENERREQQRQLPRHQLTVIPPRLALRRPPVRRQYRRQPQQAHPLHARTRGR